ncbi:MAG: hypothetical protein DCC57_14065 [Chloroflexi bacterium]|nr:MAG: hypothetical protein DCC57_14065 [Chloroflexota bacterium]
METIGIWPALVPLILAAVGVERAVEIIWNYLEWLLLGVFKWEPAQLKSAQYVQFKSGTSLVFGVVIGILLTNATNLRLFAYLRPLAPGLLDAVAPAWDVLITGFIIGAGAKPVHDLLGIITQTKNVLENWAIRQREAAGAELADGVLKLAQSEAQATVDIPGIGPARMPAPGYGIDEDEEPGKEPSATERYVELLHRRTMM